MFEDQIEFIVDQHLAGERIEVEENKEERMEREKREREGEAECV